MMNACLHVLRNGLLSVALLGTIGGPTSATAQRVASEETVRSVQRMLERLPYYGVFDYIVFRVDRGTVYLAGYSFEGRLKADAEMARQELLRVREEFRIALAAGLVCAGFDREASRPSYLFYERDRL